MAASAPSRHRTTGGLAGCACGAVARCCRSCHSPCTAAGGSRRPNCLVRTRARRRHDRAGWRSASRPSGDATLDAVEHVPDAAGPDPVSLRSRPTRRQPATGGERASSRLRKQPRPPRGSPGTRRRAARARPPNPRAFGPSPGSGAPHRRGAAPRSRGAGTPRMGGTAARHRQARGPSLDPQLEAAPNRRAA